MRPDEHKKKRSAQYQRKQGGAGAKGGKDESGTTSTKPGKGQKAEKIPQTSHTGERQDSSEDEVKETDVVKKSFRRREIVSNWAKYDAPYVEEDKAEVLARGQDFHKVLQSAGSAASHFRFKDEEGWEDNEEAGVTSPIMSLDCNQLASSLDCLPLYSLLQLDTNIFTPQQLEGMNKRADEQREKAGLPPWPKLEPTQSTPESAPPSQLKAQTSSKSPSSVSSPSVSVANNHPKERGDRLTSVVTNTKEESPKGRSHTVERTTEGFMDADLDSLLDCPEERNEKDSRLSEEQVCGKGEQGAKVEAVENSRSPKGLQDDDHKSAAEVSAAKEDAKASESTADLEDWLDSVLDS